MAPDIWRVTFAYETPGERASNRGKKVYTLVADSKNDAYNKAYENFSGTRTFLGLRLVDHDVRTTLTKLTSQKIKFPQLTLEEDLERYEVSAKLSDGGKSIEYCVSERELED